MWGFWVAGFGGVEVMLCGVNADGSLKYPNWDLLLCTLPHSAYADDTRFVKDGSGGLAYVWGDHADGRWAIRHIFVHRILADGSKMYHNAPLVMDWPSDDFTGSFDTTYHIRRDPQGGYVITTERYWQRVTDDLIPQWDIRGVLAYDWEPPFWNLDFRSNPVIMSDRSVLQLCTNAEFDLAYLEQLDSTGVRPLVPTGDL